MHYQAFISVGLEGMKHVYYIKKLQVRDKKMEIKEFKDSLIDLRAIIEEMEKKNNDEGFEIKKIE